MFFNSVKEKNKLRNEVNRLLSKGISDHDGPYIGINARIGRYQPRFKYICDNAKFILEDFKVYFQKLPFSAVYAMEDPEDKLDIFNTLYHSQHPTVHVYLVTVHKSLKNIK